MPRRAIWKGAVAFGDGSHPNQALYGDRKQRLFVCHSAYGMQDQTEPQTLVSVP